jgi:ribosomal protein S10
VTKEDSSVQIQMMTKNREDIDLALDQIQEVAESCGIELSHGSQE